MGRKKKKVGLLGVAIGAAYLPVGVALQMAKKMNKPKRRKTGGRGHGKKDYWPHNK